jgi:uncharacterized protein (DUF58 family)
VLTREELREIRKIEIVTTRLVNQQLAGSYHSAFKGRGMSFDEVRLYQPGDEIRFIDWNVSARSEDVYVKRFVEERELTVMILVDMSGSLDFGTRGETKRRLAAKLGALLAFSAIKNNDRVGLILFTDKVERFVPPKKGRRHVLRLVSEILSFHPENTGTSIAAGLEFLLGVSRRQGIAVIISDFLDQNFEKTLRIAARRHDLVPIVLSDPWEEQLPNIGAAFFEDPETGEILVAPTHSGAYRRRVQELKLSEQARLDATFTRMRLDAVRLRTGDPLFAPLLNYFRLRARRMR